MSGRTLEKRTEPRFAAAGSVSLDTDEPGFPPTLDGELVDVSASGFRARHSCPAFHTGLEVHFRHHLAQGRARVVWNRILGGAVETGFLVLASS